MACKLILTDIDRTILPWGQSIVDEVTRSAFHKALDAGIHIGPATGRGLAWLEPLFAGDGQCYKTCVATNGNQVMLDGKKVREARFAGKILQGVVDVVARFSHAGVIAFDGFTPTLVSGRLEDLEASFPAYGKACRAEPDGSACGLPDFPAVKANAFIAEEGQDGKLGPACERTTRKMIDALNNEVEDLDFDYPQPGFSNIMHAGWNKASGILALVDRLGISRDEVVVFGDAGNDLAMFDAIPNSVAVANATPEATRAARWHIGACADDAVANAIEELAVGSWPFTK